MFSVGLAVDRSDADDAPRIGVKRMTGCQDRVGVPRMPVKQDVGGRLNGLLFVGLGQSGSSATLQVDGR